MDSQTLGNCLSDLIRSLATDEEWRVRELVVKEIPFMADHLGVCRRTYSSSTGEVGRDTQRVWAAFPEQGQDDDLNEGRGVIWANDSVPMRPVCQF